MKTWIVMPLALAFVLTGCTRADNQMGASTEQGRERTSMVRGMDSADMSTAMDQCNQMMMQHMGTADQNYDQRFIDMMSRHHQGAIRMAEDAVKNAQHPEIKQFAQNVIDDQQKEISQLESWRTQWYGSTAKK